MKIKQKILTGFPCNNGEIYVVITENRDMYTINNENSFKEAMKEGYIEIEENN